MSAEQQTGSMQQQAKEAASQLTDQVRTQSANVVQQAQDTATQAVSQQKGRAAESVSTLAQALRQTGQHLHEQDQGTFGRVAQQAADRLEQFSDDLQNKSVDEMVGDVENFARRDPQLFLGGAFLLGLLGARFLKSSASRQQPQQPDMRRYYQGAPGRGAMGQGRMDYGHEALDDDYTGTYMPNYSSGTTLGSHAETSFPPSEPGTRPSGYPADRDPGDSPYSGPPRRTDE